MNEEPEMPTISGEIDFTSLYRLSQAHDLAHLVWVGLQKNNVSVPEKARQAFGKQTTVAVYRDIRRSSAIDEFRQIMADAGIPFILLKGATIAALYPESWMRTSADVDALVPESDFRKTLTILNRAGMKRICETQHDVTFETRDHVHLELHHTLIEESRNEKAFLLLKNVWETARKREDNTSEYVLPDEVVYAYYVAHMAKHLVNGGCGVRSILDLWLLNHKVDFDPAEREKALEAGGLVRFEEKARAVAEIWFSGEKDDSSLSDLESFILNGGAYGTIEQGVAFRSQSAKSKPLYYLNRVFPSFEQMKTSYPALKKAPILLPGCWVARWLKLLDPKKRHKAVHEIEVERSLGEEKTRRIDALLDDLGLR